MGYEYSAAGGRLEIPNPYRIEVIARLIAGGVATAAGVALLIMNREAIGSGDGGGIMAIVTGFLLLPYGLWYVGSALANLRYFFGRNRPADLTPPPYWRQPPTTANYLKENLRQNALLYLDVHGPIPNLVHGIFKTLIFAPWQLRMAAETQASNLLLTLALMLGMGIGYYFYPDPAVRSWIAVGFLIVLIPKLLKSLAPGKSAVSVGSLFLPLVIALPLVGPPGFAKLASSLPDITAWEFGRTLWIALVILLVSQTLFFLSLLRHLREQPAINMACEQRALNMNGNPAKLFEELERTLQTRWTDTIPNRQYANRKLPDILAGKSGSFDGEILEESQPMPVAGPKQAIAEMATSETNKFVAALTGLAMLAVLAVTLAAWRFATSSIVETQFSTLFLAAVLGIVGHYSFACSHFLWGRVDFNSVLVWVEILGSFEESQLNLGNQMTTTMSSQKKVINVEGMTLRVWAAELDTVIFEKNGIRTIIGMRGRPDIAQFYADHLQRFAAGLSNVVAPMSNTDVERIAKIAQVQQMLAAPQPVPIVTVAAPATQPAHVEAPKASSAPAAASSRCPNEACGRETIPGAAFCGFCGVRLIAGPQPGTGAHI